MRLAEGEDFRGAIECQISFVVGIAKGLKGVFGVPKIEGKLRSRAGGIL
jgi:hypothetical protein